MLDDVELAGIVRVVNALLEVVLDLRPKFSAFLFVACSEWWLRFLDEKQVVAGIQVPLLRNGFRLVVFSIVIMIVVLFFRRGIMGPKELPDLFRRKEERA